LLGDEHEDISSGTARSTAARRMRLGMGVIIRPLSVVATGESS
jgi:hypothetical protein